jgi:WD40 repeat protein
MNGTGNYMNYMKRHIPFPRTGVARIAVLAALLLLATSVLAQDAAKQINVADTRQEIASGNFAIVVGVNDYVEDDIADLNYCEKDAQDFAGALTAEGGYSADRVKLFLGKNATYTAIYAALISCEDAKNIPPKSSILFYFSGHGFAYDGKNYIIPQDGTVFPDLIQSRNLNLESIESMLVSSPFERQLVFIDACRNQVTIGGRDVGVKGFVETPLTANAKGMKVFLGTEFGQVSRESTDIQSGIFTHYLVEGLAGAADANHDGIVLFNELSGYVSTKMEERNLGSKYPQRPVTRGEGSELIPVAASPGGLTETTTTGGATSGGTVEAVTPAGAGTSASGFGTLKLAVGLDGVQCYVDGALKGSSSGGAITVENLAPGEHTIKLVKEGYETREFKAQVFAGQIIEKSLNFSKISGIIRVTSNAYPFSIYLDGAYVTLCQSASYDITDVAYGAHTVVLKKSGYADAEYKVTITGSAPVAVQAALTRVYGQLTIITNPSGATVKITSSDDIVVSAGFNGKSFNSGAEASASEPLYLTPGSYTVTISKDGYETITKSVTIATNAPAVIDVELKKRTQPITPAPGTVTKPPTIVPTTTDWSKGARRFRTFTGHTGSVNSVAFSPDGRYALTGSDDETAKLWSVPDGACVRTFTGHTYVVDSVAFCPTGQYIATGSLDDTAKLWRVSDGVCVRTFTGHTSIVSSIAFSPDGEYIATGSWDLTAKLWRVSDGACVRTFTGHTYVVYSVAYSPDGQYIATGSGDNTAKVWLVSDGACIRTFTGHTSFVESVAYSPDGQYIVTGSDDNTAKFWRVSDGACLRTFTGYGGSVLSVAFCPTGQYIATGSHDSTAKLWRVSDGEWLATLDFKGAVLEIAWSPDGRYLAGVNGNCWTGSDLVNASAYEAVIFEPN